MTDVELPDELQPVLHRLPVAVLDLLKLGPIDEDDDTSHNCRVCQALFPLAHALTRGGHGQSSTRWHVEAHASLTLFDWHQGVLPDSCAHEPRILEGPAAYARCCALYRAAGWNPYR